MYVYKEHAANEDPVEQLAIEIRVFTAMINKLVSRNFEQRLAARYPGVSALQFGILRLVGQRENTISEISAKMMLAPATLVPAVDKLEKEGFLLRGKDPRDRRRNPLHLTEKGEHILDDVAFVSPEDSLYQAIASIGEAQARDFCARLRTLFAALSPRGDVAEELLAHLGVGVPAEERGSEAN